MIDRAAASGSWAQQITVQLPTSAVAVFPSWQPNSSGPSLCRAAGLEHHSAAVHVAIRPAPTATVHVAGSAQDTWPAPLGLTVRLVERAVTRRRHLAGQILSSLLRPGSGARDCFGRRSDRHSERAWTWRRLNARNYPRRDHRRVVRTTPFERSAARIVCPGRAVPPRPGRAARLRRRPLRERDIHAPEFTAGGGWARDFRSSRAGDD